MIPALNIIIALCYSVEHPSGDIDVEGQIGELETRGIRFDKDMTAYLRVQDRRGLRKKPTNIVEVGLFILDELKATREVLEGILDVMRFKVGLASLVLRFSCAFSLMRMFFRRTSNLLLALPFRHRLLVIPIIVP